MTRRLSPLFVSVALAASCGGRVESTCRQTIDAYCANPLTPCVRHVDPTDIVPSYCGQPGAQRGPFGVFDCTSVATLAFDGSGAAASSDPDDTPATWYAYDRSSGELVRVESVASPGAGSVVACEAGASGTPDFGECDTDFVAYACNP
jgi:hypothetical protein